MPWSMFLGPIVSIYFMLTIEGCYPLDRNIVNTHLVKHGYVILHIGRVLAFRLYCTCFMMTCLPWSILHIMYLLVSMWQLCSFHNCNTTNTIFWHVSLLHELQLMILVDDAGEEWPMIGHAPWNGCNLADFVMPFFLFIVGMSIALAFKVGLATLFEHATTSFRELILLFTVHLS